MRRSWRRGAEPSHSPKSGQITSRLLAGERTCADLHRMPTHDEIPAWELRGEPPPHERQFEIERERLRLLRAENAREEKRRIERRRARTSVPPPLGKP